MYSIDQWFLWSCYSLSCKFLFRHFSICIIYSTGYLSTQRCRCLYLWQSIIYILFRMFQNLYCSAFSAGWKDCHENVEMGKNVSNEWDCNTHPFRTRFFKTPSPAPLHLLHQRWKHARPGTGDVCGLQRTQWLLGRVWGGQAVPGLRAAGGQSATGRAFPWTSPTPAWRPGGPCSSRITPRGQRCKTTLPSPASVRTQCLGPCAGQAHQVKQELITSEKPQGFLCQQGLGWFFGSGGSVPGSERSRGAGGKV